MADIAFIAPAPLKGSGGVYRIYNFANALISAGHSCEIYVFDAELKSESDLNKDKIEFYGFDQVPVIKGTDITKSLDLLFATRWDTADMVRRIPSARKAYLVQDFEPWFNPLGDGTIAAENSYLYGLQAITYGRWLALKLFSEYGNQPYFLNFATDPKSFNRTTPMEQRLNGDPGVCFIFQPEKPRRCPRLGIEALGIVKHYRPDVKLYFVGAAEYKKLWYEYENLGILTTSQLNDVYNKCQVGFCISSSNPSCNPFDMMAAGLPVVELYRENNLYDIPDKGVLLAQQTPESLAEAILLILSDRERLISMSNFGVEYMKPRHVTAEVSEFLAAVEEILHDMPHEFDFTAASATRYAMAPVVAQRCMNPEMIRQLKFQRDKLKPLVNHLSTNDEEMIPITGKFIDLSLNHQDAPNHNSVCMGLLHKFFAYLKKLIA